MPLNGIDVSQWQGEIDWKEVKDAGIKFAMIRAGYGKNNIDNKFHQNAQRAVQSGISIGLYWFSYAWNTEMARKEAQYTAALARQYKITWPIAYDLEYDTIEYARKNGVIITKNLATNMAKAFCEEIERQGYIPMIYANLEYLNEYLDRSRLPYALWYAQYALEASVREKAIWQYTSEGSVPGIQGAVDLDYGYKDYGSGNTVVPEETGPGGTILELAAAVMEGKYGVGEERKKALGNRYQEVQDFINHIARASTNTLVQEVWQGKYGNGEIRKIVLGDRYQEVQDKINDYQPYYYYTIRPGDTLSGIAQRFGTTVKKLQSWNGIKNPDIIYAGTKIRVR